MPRAKYATNADGYKRRQITYTDSAGNTRTKRLTAKTDKELDAKIAAFYKSIGAGTVSMDSRTTFGEYVDYFIESHTSTWKPSTVYNNACQANMLCQMYGNRLLSSFTPSFVAASFGSLSSTSRRFARAVFRSAYNDGLLARDPGINLKLCDPPSCMHRALTR